MATRPDGRPARGLGQEALVELTRRILARIAGDEAAAAMGVTTFRDDASVRVPAESAAAVLRALRDDREGRFEMLMDVTCVHFPKRALPLGDFDVVYHVVSLSQGHRLRIKVACPDPVAGVASVTSIWPGADYMEREARDMFGVTFQGHPDPRRILMGDDYEGWPMRKDFPYRGH